MDKILLVDGNSIFYRSFYALPLLKSEHGYSNAVYGFANMLLKAVELIKPTHVAVAFDVSKHTFRNEIYSEYKANRKPMPEELREQIPVLKEMLTLMGIKYLEKQGLEGDDILGTIAHRFNVPVVILTGDRDCFQLIDNTTTICRTMKGATEVQMMDEKAFMEEYGLKPTQIIDMKAIAGDSSDNIPGVLGLGEKTAITLLQKYESVEGIYEHINEITGKTQEKLIADKENAFLSKKLATINDKVDIPCMLDEMKFEFPFNKELYSFFEKYQMRTLLRRNELWKSEVASAAKKFECENVIVADFLQLETIILQIENVGIFGFDINTESNFMQISDGVKNYTINLLEFDIAKVLQSFSKLFESSSVLKIGFDIKTSLHMLNAYNIELKQPYFDVSLARYLLDGINVKDIDSFFFEQGYDKNLVAYCLVEAQKQLVSKMENADVQKLYENLELPLVEVLYEMERSGFMVDIEKLNELKEKYEKERDALENQIYSLAGKFNLNSPKQLGEILYDKLNLPHGKKKSTSVDDLELIRDMHEIVPLILRYRKVFKFLSTYIYGMEKHLDKNSRIHTTFKQTLTGTGRLSSTEPNLQNIPIRGEESKEIRSMFVASSKSHVLVDADYSQIELRLLAHLSEEKNLINAFANGKDIHTDTAKKIFNVPDELVTSDMRRIAKVVNFGVIYGISDFGLASDLGITPREAKKYISEFFESNPKVAQYMQEVVKNAKESGEVRTICGRIRKMIEITSTNFMVRSRAERAAQNAPLQGSAADIIKIAMVRVANRLKRENLAAKLIMQVHDELIVDCPIAEKEKVEQILKQEMESAYALKVPLLVDASSAYRWSDSH